MADTLRHTILDAMKTTLEGITVASGYRNTVVTVEFAARPWNEIETSHTKRPYIGIIPQREDIFDEPSLIRVDWNVQLVAHVTPSARTTAAMMNACEDIVADIRKALYTSGNGGNLNVDGVSFIKIIGRQGSEGEPEAAQENVASVMLDTIIRFYEGFNDG